MIAHLPPGVSGPPRTTCWTNHNLMRYNRQAIHSRQGTRGVARMQQQQSFQANAPISDDVTRLANEQQLGAPQAGYLITQLRRGWRWFRFGIPVLFIIVIISIFPPLLEVSSFFSNNLAPIFFLLYILLFVLSAIYIILSIEYFKPALSMSVKADLFSSNRPAASRQFAGKR